MAIVGCSAVVAHAQYDRGKAVSYMDDWANSSTQEPPPPQPNDTSVKTDLVNSSTYTWHYQVPKIPSIGRLSHAYGLRKILMGPVQTNNGDGTIPTVWGFDCANFVSQVLIAGMIDLQGGDFVAGSPNVPDAPLAKGGTYISVDRLAAVLPSISEVSTGIVNAGGFSGLSPGDVIQFETIEHMIVVYSTNPLTYAGHTTDRLNEPVSNIQSIYYPAVSYHITGNAITKQTDTTPPTVVPFTEPGGLPFSDGDIIYSSSIQVVVNDLGSGIQKLYLSSGAPVVNGETNYVNGSGAIVLADLTPRGSSYTYTLPSNLSYGLYFIDVFDIAGNDTELSFYYSPPAPHITLTLPTVQFQPVIYNDFFGINTSTNLPETNVQLNGLTALQPLNLIAVPDPSSPAGTSISMITLTWPDGTAAVVSAASPGNWTIPWPTNASSFLGVSTLTVVDSNGGVTFAPFLFVQEGVTSNVANSTATACPANINLTFYASQGLFSYTDASVPPSQASAPPFPNPTLFSAGLTTATLSLATQGTADGTYWTYEVMDNDGNQMAYSGAAFSASDNSPGACIFGSAGGPFPGNVRLFEGQYDSVPLGSGISASNVAVVNQVMFNLFVVGNPLSMGPGLRNAMQGENSTIALNLMPDIYDYSYGVGSAPYLPPPFTLNVPLDPSLTTAQLNNVMMAIFSAAAGQYTATSPVTVSQGPTGPVASFTVPSSPNTYSQTFRFVLLAPDSQSPVVLSTAGVTLLYNGASTGPALNLALADPTQPPLAALAASAASAGLTPLSAFAEVTPFGTAQTRSVACPGKTRPRSQTRSREPSAASPRPRARRRITTARWTTRA